MLALVVQFFLVQFFVSFVLFRFLLFFFSFSSLFFFGVISRPFFHSKVLMVFAIRNQDRNGATTLLISFVLF